MILETTRLRLRPLAASDLDALCAIAADPQVMAHVGDGVPLSRAATALWINNAAASLMMSEVGSRAVVLRGQQVLPRRRVCIAVALPGGEPGPVCLGHVLHPG